MSDIAALKVRSRLVATWGKRGAWLTLAVLILGATSCGGGGGAQSAVKNGLKGAGFEEVSAVKGSVDESGQLTVEGESGSKVVLDIVEEGGKFVIENCTDLLVGGSSCNDVPTGQPLEP